MKKLIICVITIMSAVVFMLPHSIVYADPMDPMDRIRNQGTTQATSETVGEGFLPNTPEVDAVDPNNVSGQDGSEDTTEENKTQEDWEQEEKQRSLVQFMDSVMLVVGVIGVIVPTIFMGIYLGARIYPHFFCPIFGFLTRHQTDPEDIPWYMMFARTIPVAVLGMMLATGWLRNVFATIWSFVLTHFLK